MAFVGKTKCKSDGTRHRSLELAIYKGFGRFNLYGLGGLIDVSFSWMDCGWRHFYCNFLQSPYLIRV